MMMTQQNWPFENRICGVTSGQEMNDTDDDDEADDDQDVADENKGDDSKFVKTERGRFTARG